jgi:photosystem II stability/assembly factor-like uncharacterized protein
MNRIKCFIVIISLIISADGFSQGSINDNNGNPLYITQTTGWYQIPSPTVNTLNGFYTYVDLPLLYGDAGSFFTKNSGAITWINGSVPSAYNIKGVTRISSGTYACGTGGKVYRSTNAGTSWINYLSTYDPGSNPTFNINSVWSVSGSEIYIVGDGGNFAYGANLGSVIYEWLHYPTGTTENLNSLTGGFVQGGNGIIIAVGNNGTILKSIYPYSSWSIKSSGTTENLYCVVKTGNAGGQLAVVTGANGTILRSTNSGDTWIQSVSNTTSDLYCVCYQGAIGFACGENGTILFDNYGPSLNRGVNWIPLTTPTTQSLYGVTGIGNSEAFAVGAGGIMLRTTTGGSALKLNLTAFIQGFYSNTTNKMIKDTATVFLRNNTSPFSIVDTARSVLDSTGKGSFYFNKISIGSNYFIALKHRNSMETWSAAGAGISPDSISYNFTNAITKAFGNNQVQVDASPVGYAVYSGDMNQDGFINLTDVLGVYNAASSFVNGYVPSDMNGDYLTDLTDILITNNNSNNFVSLMRP